MVSANWTLNVNNSASLLPGTGVTAESANDFLTSLGVNFFNDGIGAPNNWKATILQYEGFRNIRVGGDNGISDNGATLIDLAQRSHTKITWNFQWMPLCIGCDDNMTAARISQGLAVAKQLANAGVLLDLEGANEPDNWGITCNGVKGGGIAAKWANTYLPVAQCQALEYQMAKADPILKNYPVWSISHVGTEPDNTGMQWLAIPSGSGVEMPDGTVFADYANAHNYVIWDGAPTPVDNIAWNNANPSAIISPAQWPFVEDFGLTWAAHYQGYTTAQLQKVPRVTTETGWVSNNGGVDAQDRVLLNVLLSQFKRGWKYTFLFTLTDSETDVPGFGLYDANNNPKPIATHIHNLTTILNDNKSVSPTPGKLNYSIASEPVTVHDMLLQKSTGQFELVVWDERTIGEATDNVTVNLGASHGTVNVYDVTAGTAPVKTLANISSVPLILTDHPLIVEVIN